MTAMADCRMQLRASCGRASAGTGWFRGHAPNRKSTLRSARPPCRIRRAAPLRTCADRDTTRMRMAEVVLLEPLHQQVVIVYALAPADDLSVAFGSEHVYTKRQLGPIGVSLQVKRLDRRRIAIDHDWNIDIVPEQSFIGIAEIPAPLDLTSFACSFFTASS